MVQFIIGWVFWAFMASMLTGLLSKQKLDEKHFEFWVLCPLMFVVFFVFGLVKKQLKGAMKAFYKSLFP